MFPSPNPFEYSLLNITSSSSSSSSFPSHHHHNPSPLFNFPSPFLNQHESPLNQIFLQTSSSHNDHQRISDLACSKVETVDVSEEAPLRRRRGVGKKDRHSKIRTAQGIRDRRMRLSLQVARKFFDLQDMLGYDKASKTIEWLFTHSNEAIKDLLDDHQSPPPPPPLKNPSNSGSSEYCQDMSGSIEEINSHNVVAAPIRASATTRESREKARERARCRTREKMLVKRLRFSGDCFKPNPNSPFEEEIRVSSYTSSLEQWHLSDAAMIEKFLGNSTSSTSCPISDYHGGAVVVGVTGNWDHVMSNYNNERSNCLQYAVANEVTFAGNFDSVYPVTAPAPELL